jgi:DNA repair exonuclease SbcCD ATPase subunit
MKNLLPPFIGLIILMFSIFWCTRTEVTKSRVEENFVTAINENKKIREENETLNTIIDIYERKIQKLSEELKRTAIEDEEGLKEIQKRLENIIIERDKSITEYQEGKTVLQEIINQSEEKSQKITYLQNENKSLKEKNLEKDKIITQLKEKLEEKSKLIATLTADKFALENKVNQMEKDIVWLTEKGKMTRAERQQLEKYESEIESYKDKLEELKTINENELVEKDKLIEYNKSYISNIENENNSIKETRDLSVLYKNDKGRFIDLIETSKNVQIKKPSKEITALSITFVVQKKFREGIKKAKVSIIHEKGDCKKFLVDEWKKEILPRELDIKIQANGHAEILFVNKTGKQDNSKKYPFIYLCRDCTYRMIITYGENEILNAEFTTD